MYFLNPAILIALSAVSIPIIIHLFNLQKIRKIEFSTLMFLKELQKSKIKRIKLKQLLLLLLRIMVIVFLVLSFAKPVFKGYAGAGAVDVRKTVVIILDNSFSMSAAGTTGTYLQQSRDAVRRILASHSESDEFYFIPSSEILFKDKKVFYSSKKELLDSLENTGISYKPAAVSEQVNLAGEIFASSLNQINELFIISDFQRSNFYSAVSAGGLNLSLKERNVNLFLLNTGNRKVNNISLDSVAVVSKLLEKERDIKLKVTVNNHTDFNVTNKIINLYSGGLLVGEKAVDLNSLEKKEIEFNLKLDRTGYISGYFELMQNDLFEDEIFEDNKFYLTLYVPEVFKIGIIENSPDDSKFIRLAFSSAQEFLSGPVQRENFFDLSVTGINPSVNNFDLVFITGKRTINESEAGILKDYITNGGGVFIFPSEDIDVNSYNRFLSEVNSSRIGSLNDNQSINQNLRFDKIDFEHPVLSEVFQSRRLSLTEEQLNIESPAIFKYYDILPGENSSTIITLSNNKSFLASSGFNSGKVLLSAISPGTGMSDFQSKSIFLPVIIRSTYYLGNNYRQQNENYIGKNNLVMLNNAAEVMMIRNPAGEEKEFNFTAGKGRINYMVIPYERLFSEPGIYELKNPEGNFSRFSLNHDPAESRSDKMNRSELEDLFEELEFNNVLYIDPGEEITLNIKEARTGLELWKYFLFAALIFLALELFLSKRMERE